MVPGTIWATGNRSMTQDCGGRRCRGQWCLIWALEDGKHFRRWQKEENPAFCLGESDQSCGPAGLLLLPPCSACYDARGPQTAGKGGWVLGSEGSSHTPQLCPSVAVYPFVTFLPL